MKIKHSDRPGLCPRTRGARATGARHRRFAGLALAALIQFAGSPASAAEPRTVILADRTDVPVTVYPATGNLLALWLPTGYSTGPAHGPTAAGLAGRGVEVWQADLLEGRFLPPLETSIEQVPPADVAELIEIAHRRTGKRVMLVAQARAAILALAGAREWQVRNPGSHALAGALLVHPNLFRARPEPGHEADYHPVTAQTSLPIEILQPGLSPWYWRLEATVAELAKGGAPVRVERLPDIRDRFDTRSDANDREQVETKRLPEWLAAAAGRLAQATAKAVPKAAPAAGRPAGATESARARELKPYAGQPQAPALALEVLGGGRADLAALRGQVVLVNFWASWCPPCVREMPSMQRLKDRMAGRAFSILAVNMGETEREISAFFERMTVDFPVLLDRDGQALKRWKVFVFPTSFVIDPGGQIRYGVFGEVEWDSPEVLKIIEGLWPAHATDATRPP